MERIKTIHPSEPSEQTEPGPLYPDRCLDCPELYAETYGGVCFNRCAACATADRKKAKRREGLDS